LLKELDAHIHAQEDFAFETTLSGRGYLRLIKRLQKEGWHVELLYLALPNVNMSLLRVAERVAHGGHNITAENIARRFPRSLRNLFKEYSTQADRTRCFMNSGNVPELIFEQQGEERMILNEVSYQLLLKEADK